jgi:uncharacterized membrane protein/uncharacterized protein YecT (DUF1311 family)
VSEIPSSTETIVPERDGNRRLVNQPIRMHRQRSSPGYTAGPLLTTLVTLVCALLPPRSSVANGPPNGSTLRELRCLGNEPFWSLQVQNESAKFSGLFQEEVKLTLEGEYAHLPFRGTHAWRGRSAPEAADLVAFFLEASCSDTMSDEVYPYTASVSAPDGRLLAGCCRGGPLPGRPQPRDPQAEGTGALQECYAAAVTRLEVGPCLERKLAEAQQELERAQERCLVRMRDLDAVTSSDTGAERAFLGAQEAFLAFREGNCRWRSAELASGTGAGDVYRACLVDATRRRTEELLKDVR